MTTAIERSEPLDIPALRAVAEKATPQEPWRFSPWHIEEAEAAVRAEAGWIICTTSSDATAEFIATFDPPTVMALLDRLSSYREALERAEGHLAETLTDRRWHPIGHCPVLDLVRAALGASSHG